MDLTAIVNATRRVPAVDMRASGDRLAVTLRMLVPLVESVGSMPELARELVARTARDTVALILPAGSGQARIDLGQRQIAIPAALRDAILSALEQSSVRNAAKAVPTPETAAGAQARMASGVDPAATVRLIDASAQAWALAATQARANARGTERAQRAAVRRSTPTPHATFDAPLLDEQPDAARAAIRLRDALHGSGLFRDSQLAGAHEAPGAPLSDLVRTGVHVAATSPAAARIAAQLDVLARGAVLLQGLAWPGQMALIELGREPGVDANAHGEAAAKVNRNAFCARLKLDLPQLGPLEVCLHLVGASVAASIETAQPKMIERELPQLAAHLEARGLQAALLQAVAPR